MNGKRINIRAFIAFFSIFLTLIVLPSYALEEKEYVSDGYQYIVLPDDTIQLTRIPYDSSKKKCVVPSIVNDFKVSSVRSNALQYVFNDQIVFSEGIEELVGYCGFSFAKEITIPSTMKIIDSKAENGFVTGKNIEKINISSKNPTYGVKNGFVYNKKTNTLLCYPAASKTKKITTPKGIETISSGCFSNLKYTESIVISEGVTTIGFNAFRVCENLKNVKLPSTLNWNSYEYDFHFCKQMAKISVSAKNPDLVVQNGALINKSTHKLLYMPSQYKIKSYTVPDDIIDIEYGAFSYCIYLESIRIPQTVEIIEGNAFYGCPKLKKAILEEGIRFIAKSSFDNCPHLTKMTYPNNAELFVLPPLQYCTEQEIERLKDYGL